jgi:hypothetical protein
MLLYLIGLIVAIGGPISLFTGADVFGNIKRHWLSGTASASQPANAAVPGDPAAPLSGGVVANDPTPMLGLSEVLRFDVTVEWVLHAWPRVSTGMPYMQLQGYRVPLVTGTSIADVAGSLTYYFNAQQKAQRITFHGSTGDPQAMVALLAERFRFSRRLTNDPGLVVYETVDANSRLAGSLKMRSARVVRANQPYSRFDVELVIDRPE